MTILTDVDVSSLSDLEFSKACENKLDEPCPHPAEWMVWIRHGNGCVPDTILACTSCRDWGESYWTEVLKNRDTCATCGHQPTGQLSDYLRVIRL